MDIYWLYQVVLYNLELTGPLSGPPSAINEILVSSVISDPKKTNQLGEQPAASNPAEEDATGEPVARIDLWFDRQITQLYGEVAEEPIPQEILDLVNKLKAPH